MRVHRLSIFTPEPVGVGRRVRYGGGNRSGAAGRRRSQLRGADRVGGECRVSCGRHRRRGVAVPARRPAHRSALARAARGGWPGRGQDATRGQNAAARAWRCAAGRGQLAGQAAGPARVRRDPGRPGRAGLVPGARARRAPGPAEPRGRRGRWGSLRGREARPCAWCPRRRRAGRWRRSSGAWSRTWGCGRAPAARFPPRPCRTGSAAGKPSSCRRSARRSTPRPGASG